MTTTTRPQRLATSFDRALDALERSAAFAKPRHQEAVFALASDLLDLEGGLEVLEQRADRFDDAGVFHGGPWAEPARLLPPLVGPGLLSDGVYPTLEALSCLRVLALADGRATREDFSKEEARGFLAETAAYNVGLVVESGTEEARTKPKLHRRARRLFESLRRVVPLEVILERTLDEMEMQSAQRPVRTRGLRALVHEAHDLRAAITDPDALSPERRARLDEFVSSLGAVTELSREAGDPLAYRKRLIDLDTDALVEQATQYARVLHATGIGSPYHTVVLRLIARREPERIGEALGCSDAGRAEAARCAELAGLLVNLAVVPDTRDVLLGLANALERNLLSRKEVAGGLRKIADLTIRPEIAEALLERFDESTGLTASSVLLGGCLGVLGLPLGVGQGNNPTCQSARGISLWSQHAPGELLSKVASVARDGFYETTFEGHAIRSDLLGGGVAVGGIDLDLDPVSQVLVPHLDRVYDHMMLLAAGRAEDGHRWVNPVLYGRWIQYGFATAFDMLSGRVVRHGSFVRRFYATHHPAHNDGHELIYPNPVGIMVTDAHGRLLGRHAVLIQRVARDEGVAAAGDTGLRVYFYNPNNEGRQDWGFGVRPTVAGHGERHGESSLPFGEFASRLYAFHYDPQEEGDAFAVPASDVTAVTEAAAKSWGTSVDGFA